MKQRSVAALTLVSLLLTGCSSMLERDYVHVTAHNTAPTAEGNPSTLRAENYQELVNALLYFVTQGVDSGSVRLYSDAENVDTELEAACLEVVQEDPLGAYAVGSINYDVTPIVSYCQADVQIIYRRTPAQIASIVSATGTTAIRNELERALSSFATELVLRISYFDQDESFLQALCRQAYYASPASALNIPDLSVVLYPDAGRQRIAELTLNYHLDRPELERRRDLLTLASAELAGSLRPSSLDSQLILDAGQAILKRSRFDPKGGSTAYHALLEGKADSLGLALALTLVGQELDFDCRVVEGSLDGSPRHWNVVFTETGWRHVDLTHWNTWDSPFRTDDQMEADGFTWDRMSIPACNQPPSLP